MKKLLVFATAIALSLNSYAQSEDDMKAWMDYATPGAMHKMLGKYNGFWEASTKMWMAPGTPAMESTANVTNDMYMADHYQKSIFSGDFQGMPFQGESMTGYDNVKKVFMNTWIDNMSTGVMYSEGTWNEATKSIEFKGMATDPMAGKQLPFREVVTYTSNDSYKMEMYNTMNGKEFKSMEVVFTRKK
ncbi:MAG: DUF1579 domain-containing protein [Chitinophagales bacterium]|nr:DUF1579 domain-containing protein [Chitinophagales bacterium]